jgi:tRNA(Ile2) C34 agmatinyltransferase TiaS
MRDSAGVLKAQREELNSVLRSGADLLARLFSRQGAGISHMAVGSNGAPEPDSFGTDALADATEVALAADAFQIDPPDPVKRVVRVRVRGTVPAAAAVGTIREAALVAHDGATVRLYNRVTFAPIDKAGDHELTLFWEIGFPYGDLQWLL